MPRAKTPPREPDPETLQLYQAATREQYAAMRVVTDCAKVRRECIHKFVADGMSQLQISVAVDLTQATVYRIFHKGDR